MKMLVAVDKNWGIGNENELLIRIPADQKQFRMLTTGNVVVMGRKTLDSFPNGMPLKDRVNIVLTGKEREARGSEIYVHSLEEALDEIKKYQEEGKEIYISGGEMIYRLFLPYCDSALVTRIDHAYAADAHFPNLEEDPEWEIAEESEEQTYFDIPYTYVEYRRK